MNQKRYWGMSGWEMAITLILIVLVSLLAIIQTLRAREAPYQQFIDRAQEIASALEAFAREHGGCYPDDGRDNQSPPGLSPGYIQWKEEWNIDYEVHDNGHGGNYVALEYLGRYKKNREYHALGLTLDPQNRKRYGQGQRIPGKNARIWVFYEEAPIYKPEGCVKNRAKMN
jgi:hypothetical protein